MIRIQVFIAVLIFVFIGACQQKAMEKKTDDTDVKLVSELQKITSELQTLKLELAQVKAAVTEMHRNSVLPSNQAEAQQPPPSVKAVSMDDDPVMGDAQAKFAIVEFSDYECPFCNRFFNSTFKQIKSQYIDSGKIKYVFRDYPLAFHQNAKPAATAANCAGKQNQYWAMHDKLFENQRQLSGEYYLKAAQEIGIDLASFKACIENSDQSQEIEKDFAYGTDVGVRGTPHFFIGKIDGEEITDIVQISGARPFSDFSRQIEKLLN